MNNRFKHWVLMTLVLGIMVLCFAAEAEASLSVTYPDDSSRLVSGTVCRITWDGDLPDWGDMPVQEYLFISYSLDNGATWNCVYDFCMGIPENAGTARYFYWVVPQVTEGKTARIKMLRRHMGTNQWITDQEALSEKFVISPSCIRLSTPNGAESLLGGLTYTINWLPVRVTNCDLKSTVELEYSIDSGTSWRDITNTPVDDTGSYTWTVPDTVTSTAKVRITRRYPSSTTAYTTESDVSDSYFEIERQLIIGGDALPNMYPTAPGSLQAAAQSTSSIQLTWTDTSSNEQGFRIFRKVQGGNYLHINTLGANSNSYTDSGLQTGTTYYYKVQAYNTYGSGYSDEAVTTTMSTIVQKDDGDSGSIDLPLLPGIIIPPGDEEDEETPGTGGEKATLRFYVNNKVSYVNGHSAPMDVTPVIINGRTLLPVKYVAQPLGAAIKWDGVEQKVSLSMGGTIIEMWINNNTAQINGSSVMIDPSNSAVMPTVIPPGRTMLPLRFIAENLGCDVSWNKDLQEITITKK